MTQENTSTTGSGRWQFFTVAAHRAAWARVGVIQVTGGSNYPSISNGAMNGEIVDSMDTTGSVPVQSVEAIDAP